MQTEKQIGIRYNQNKTRLGLIPPEFIEEVGKVFTFGARKYKPDNWKYLNADQKSMIIDSCLRHLMEYLKGNTLDSESGLMHLSHASANLAMLIYFETKDKEC